MPYLCRLFCPADHVSGSHAAMLRAQKLSPQHTTGQMSRVVDRVRCLAAEPLRFLKNIEEMRARARQQSADGPDDLYCRDEVPDNSQAGDDIRGA